MFRRRHRDMMAAISDGTVLPLLLLLHVLVVLVTGPCCASQQVVSSISATASCLGEDIRRAPVVFEKDFTRPMSIPEEGIQAAVEVMRSGRLFRYSSKSAEGSQVALAEREFAEATGARFAVGVNSCSSAILIALLTVGVRPGDEVLTNAFTFTAIPSTILRLGAEPVLIECNNR